MGTRLFQTMYTADQMRKAVADEREACAKVCETLGDMNKGVYGEMQIGVYSAAKSIRARGDV